MRLRLFLSTLTLGLLSLSAVGCNLVVGSGISKTESREVGSFDAVNADDSITAHITLAPDAPQEVTVSGDDNLVPLVVTTVSGGTLLLSMKSGTNISTTLPLVVTISTKVLRAIEANASAEVNANAMAGDQLAISGTSSAHVEVTQVTATQSISVNADSSAAVTVAGIDASGPITARADSSSHVKLSGKATALNATSSASSSIDAVRLTAANVFVSASSSSSADVCATVSLNATVESSSAVTYSCDPGMVSRNVDTSSTLSKK